MDRAFRGRDATYDGVFFVAVRTTGIFCRPSCPARKPLPRNVEFVGSVRDALLAGYRPCKRCRPMDTNGQPPAWVDRLLSRVERCPSDRLTDEELRTLGIDPARARRYFRDAYGLTFQAYHRHLRMGLALAETRGGADLNHVALKYGYGSTSGFRDAFQAAFGQPPGRSRAVRCIAKNRLETPIGPFEVGATPDGICLFEFADRRSLPREWATLRERLHAAVVPGTNEHVDLVKEETERYFAGGLTRFSVPLVVTGTPFQETVWRRLTQIPYGTTLSYEALARAVGKPGGQRAVGRANGDNRLAILIPCHRVVQKNGELRGYGGGLWRKQFLLDLEKRSRDQGVRVGTERL